MLPLIALFLLFAAQAFAQTSIGITPGVAASTSTSTVNGVTMPSDFSTSVSSGVVTVTHSGQTCNSGTSPCTVTSGWLIGDATSGNVTYNLPVANAQDIPISTCKSDSSVNTVTMHRNGTDTISGAAADYTLSTQHQCVLLVSTSAGNWSVRSERWASGSMPATQISGTALTAANNLSEVIASAARSNLGLGTAATSNLPVVGTPGDFSTLEQWVPQTLPTASSSLTCSGTAATYPFNDDYVGKLSGANVTYTLPTSGCADGSIITIDAIQDGSHTIAVNTSAAGGIIGSQTFLIGSSAGNQQELQYQFCSGRCGAGLNQNAWVLRADLVNPTQAWPVAAGGTGTGSTLTGLVRGSSTAMTAAELSGDVTTSGSNATTVGKINGDTLSSPPALPSIQGPFGPGTTSISTPAGATRACVNICAGGGGGGGVITGGNTACRAGSGGGGACIRLCWPNPSGATAISLGAGGAAGTTGGSPTNGGDGTNSSITLGGVTTTLTHGGGGGDISAATGSCTGGAAGTTGGQVSANLGLNIAHTVEMTVGGGAGLAGGAGTTVNAGASNGASGGNSAKIAADGTTTVAATAGADGYAYATFYGATAF